MVTRTYEKLSENTCKVTETISSSKVLSGAAVVARIAQLEAELVAWKEVRDNMISKGVLLTDVKEVV